MTGPSWLAGILAAVMIATAGYCASRLDHRASAAGGEMSATLTWCTR